MNHTPRNKQRHIGGPSLWTDEPADDGLPLLAGALVIRRNVVPVR
jgi:hypothetical protein